MANNIKSKGRTRGKREGSVFQRKDGRWVAQISVGFKPNGKRDRRTSYHETRAEAVRALSKIRAEQEAGTLSRSEGLNIEAFLARWLEFKSRQVRPVTLEVYADLIERLILPRLGKVKLDKLKPLDLEQMYTALTEDGYAPRTPRVIHTLVKGALKQAVRWQMLPRNVADAATPPRAKREEMRVWTPAQVIQFLESAQSHRLYALFYVALMTGMRKGELLGLRWQDVDLENQRLRVQRAMVVVNGSATFSDPKTRAGRRTITFGTDTCAVLEAHRHRQQLERAQACEGWHDDDLVFSSMLGTPINPSNLALVYRRLIALAGVPRIRFHDLRHTSASLLILKGENVKVVADRLGHTNTGFTNDTYVHLFDTQRESAALRLSDLFPKSNGVPN